MGLPTPETCKLVNQSIIFKGAKRGTVDLYANSIFKTKYATEGGTSRNHNTSLGFVEDALHTDRVPCKPIGSTNGSGTIDTSEGPLPDPTPAMNEASTKNASKIIPDLVLIAIHPSGSNGVDCALDDGADHIVDFKTLHGLSHYNNTSKTPGATRREKAKSSEQRVPRSYEGA